MKPHVFAVAVAVVLAGCSSQDQAVPPPLALTAEAAGHYCQMNILEHPGPKAQAHLAGLIHPVWFAQVRDALAYDRMPEESAEVTVIYVNDMATAPSWEDPGAENWIDISTAVFVVDSRQRGGMGAPELVPFSTRPAAEAFAADFGGRVVGFDEITDEMVLAPINVDHIPTTGEAQS